MAIRWSPRASTRPPRGRVGTPVTANPSSCRLRAGADRPQRVDRGLDPVGLLEAQLAGAVDPALAARAGGEQAEQRQLVDEERHLLGADRRRRQLGRAHLEVADRLGAEPPAGEDPDAAAHPLEHVEQAGAARVQTDVVDRDPRLRHERGGDDERRRRREVARHVDLAEPEPRGRVDADALGRTVTRTPAACSINSVWSRVGVGSTTVVRPVAPSAGEQDRRLHLRARDGQLVVDRLRAARR